MLHHFQMFKHQLIAEVVPSIEDRAWAPPLNDAQAIMRLLERSTGYGQFRVELPGRVEWSVEAARIHGPDHPLIGTLEDAVLAYVVDDRTRVVDTIRTAVQAQRGFHYTARMDTGDELKVVEAIGDVVLSDGVATGFFGLIRDITQRVEREAMAVSRANLIRHLVEDMPVPIVVLDRALRVVACSTEWARAYGLADRNSALRQPLGKLVEVGRETTGAIIEALKGRSTTIGLWFHTGEDRRQVRRDCAVIPWQCGADASSGVLMVVGGSEASYASLDIADRALGRTAQSLLSVLHTIEASPAN